MTIYLKQSTASQEIPLGYFVDSGDGNTEETGLTIANTDIKLWKAGATTLANKNSGGATHISNGIYYAVLDATDTNTLGSLVIFVHVSGALAIRLECVVLAANVYDSLIGAADNLQVHAAEISNDLITAAAIATGAIDADAIASDAITAAKIAANAIGASELAADAVTEIQSGLATAASIAALNNISTAQVNAEMVDVLATDTYAEPSGVPGATVTLATKIGYLYMALRNQLTVTSTKKTFFDDGGNAEWEKDLSDNGTTYTETEANSV
jgi:hypothetical protein